LINNVKKLSPYFEKLIPYLPLIFVALSLYLFPYFLFPERGDAFYHLVRAREILQSPLMGLFWDYLTYYPLGRAIWHPPLFHAIFASLWYIGGVRFAYSIFCVTQILSTVGVASWFANKYYGHIAGLFAGILALAAPRADILPVIMPAAYISILVILTINFLPKNKIKAFITSLIGIWTHLIGLIVFVPLFLIQDRRNRENIKMALLLLPSILFWSAYWIYFKNQAGTNTHIELTLQLPWYANFYGLSILLILGIIGLSILYKLNREQFKLFTFYITTIIFVQYIFGDISRGFQYAALPLAILSGLSIHEGYKYLIRYHYSIKYIFILLLLLISSLGTFSFFSYIIDKNTHWDSLSVPFEGEYNSLKEYLDTNVNQNEVIWTESDLSDLSAWMSGLRISNGRTWGNGPPKDFLEHHQQINVFVSNDTFLIKNYNNKTLTEFKKSQFPSQNSSFITIDPYY
jgi:hypothetical protein